MSTAIEPCRTMILFNRYGIVNSTTDPIWWNESYPYSICVHNKWFDFLYSSSSSYWKYWLTKAQQKKTKRRSREKMNMKIVCGNRLLFFIEKNTINAMIFVSQTNETYIYVMNSMFFAIRIDAGYGYEWQQGRESEREI